MTHSTSVYTTIRGLQRSIGIQHDDYARYRALCTTKIRHYRKSSRPKADSKGKKTVDSKYAKKDLKSEDAMVILLLAERCAAYGLEIRKETVLEPRKVFSERKKWSQAIKFSNLLLGTSFDTDELKVVRDYYQANLYFAYQRWEEAFIHFKKFLRGMKGLVNVLSEDVKVYCDKVASDSVALCRYCEHMGGISGDDFIEVDSAAAGENKTKNLNLMSVGGINWEVEESSHQSFVSAFENISSVSFEGLRNLLPENVILYLRTYSEIIKVFNMVASLVVDCKWIYSFDQPFDPRITTLQSKISKVISLLGKLNCRTVPPQLKSHLDEMRSILIFISAVFYSFTRGSDIPNSSIPDMWSGSAAFPALSFDFNEFKVEVIDRIVKLNEAKKNLQATGQRITRFGVSAPSLTNKATILADYHIPRVPFDAKKDLINDVFVPQMIPMKPIFYDFAFELLEPPPQLPL